VIIDYANEDVSSDIRDDICIVGAGAAGIVLACTLAERGLNVVVLESGGLDYDEAIQSLNDGDSVGQELASPARCRLRFLGGTTNHWQGWCAAFNQSSLMERKWVPHSGWPIDIDDLAKHYSTASHWCEIGPEADLAGSHDLPDFDPSRLDVRAWRYSPPTRFGTVYRSRFESLQHVRLFLRCNVMRLVTNAAGNDIDHLCVGTVNGKRGTVKASVFVLATGGIENARLLLMTNEAEPAGLGNRSDTLGRFFMQHIEVGAARLDGRDASALVEQFGYRGTQGLRSRLHPALAQAAQAQDSLLETGFTLEPLATPSSGVTALRELRRDFQSGSWPHDFGDQVGRMLRDLDGISEDVYRRISRSYDSVQVGVIAEQSPSPASRISLSDRLDAFGLPRLRVDWRLSPSDRQSIEGALEVLAAELARLGLGRMQFEPWLRQASPVWPEQIWGGCHHLGTTRMSADPRLGVVDANCRMHAVGNLYITGSSVFPTGSYVPPTLTIVAMALRLADHLGDQHA